MNRITLRASDVAAIIGRNKYKPRSEVFDDLWKKHRPSTFKGQTKKDRAEEALSASASARDVLASALNSRAKD